MESNIQLYMGELDWVMGGVLKKSLRGKDIDMETASTRSLTPIHTTQSVKVELWRCCKGCALAAVQGELKSHIK